MPLKEHAAREEHLTSAACRETTESGRADVLEREKGLRRWHVQIRIGIKNNLPLYLLVSTRKIKHLPDSLCDANLHC
jgi:hypothetical protein